MWLQFRQSYCLLLLWVLIAQTQYRNMDKNCEGILKQGKDLHNSRKLRKAVAIKLGNKFFPVMLWRKYRKKDRDSEKVLYSKSCCSKLIFFNQPITYSVFLVSLWTIIITEERTHIITVRSCFQTHLILFISGVCRSVCPCHLQVVAPWKESQLLCAWLT